ncbi:hypothetical protein J2Y45_001202 [Dyadobacter sp. BE34]|uniref:Uncharacterized protein n=1 Tax=Dyadobacter fermentans TaxID=94254 RepID=A0ABU1QS89_9BACT|nr:MULTISPECIES: hypothetical protein [Dyadobacter]MDR6803933.1 hypothetical protein [Dyadobacter fermentans]MDR7041673.1 hypothetical protein [Dyadobacter sp. BE242]MDR7196076.1 hypothetical protein [Dyadobacter sp. BE34]MDR7213379.1 hypothetical protein [Dyadobacter sp. BE31]MDR7261482.1 hypothetical protein [Dyadobacter sp. BE32]
MDKAINKRRDFKLTPEQQKIVDEKVRDLARAVRNVDLNNLPKRENHPDTSTPGNGSKHTEKA